MQTTQKYIAAYVPRYIRTGRLWYLSLDTVIGAKSVAGSGSMIYDLIMLPEKEYTRARLYLGMENPNSIEFSMSKRTPAYIPKYVKEISVSASELNPNQYAKRYFRQVFGLDEPWNHETEDAFARPSGHANDDYSEEMLHQFQYSNDPYVVLGVTKDMSAVQIKHRYRTLIHTYHPDKFASTGLTAEMMARANELMKRINVAYDDICKKHMRR